MWDEIQRRDVIWLAGGLVGWLAGWLVGWLASAFECGPQASLRGARDCDNRDWREIANDVGRGGV